MSERKPGWLADARQDLVYAARVLRKNPGFTAAAVLTLALGIGANAAIFQLIDATLLRTLPVRQPERLVVVQSVGSQGPSRMSFSYPQFVHVRGHARDAADLFAFATVTLQAGAGDVTETAEGLLVSDNFFSALGVTPTGRGFSQGLDDAAVLSRRFWRSRFGGDPAIVGRSVLLNGLQFTVVGITPREFSGVEVGKSPDVFVPLASCDRLIPGAPRLPRTNSFWLSVMGRLTGDVEAGEAAERLTAAYRQTADQSAGKLAELVRARRIVLLPGARGRVERAETFRRPLVSLFALVGLVLIGACTNVATLMLVRSASRRQELAIRLALGARRSRLVRQFLTESLALSALGGLAGLAVAAWGARGLTAFFPANVLDVGLDGRVLAFTFATSVAAGLLFGIPTAARASRADTTSPLDVGLHPAAPGPRLRAARLLVAAQVAIALVVLVGAGLFIRTLANLRLMDPGFRVDSVLLATVNPTLARYSSDRARVLLDELQKTVAALPGVQSVSLADAPLLGQTYIDGFSIHGLPQSVETRVRVVSPHFFDTMGIMLRRGRDFADSDRAGAPRVAIVNETIARTIFAGRDPVGVRIGIDAAEVEIVGIAGDSRYGALRDPVPNTVYLVMGQARSFGGERTLHVRTAPGSAGVAAAIRGAVRALDPNVAVQMTTFDRLVEENISRERLMATLSGALGALAVALTAVGLYGVIAFGVQRRTREIGIRISLGAAGSSVSWMVARDCVIPVGAGLAAGLVASWRVPRLAARQLFGVAPGDPLTIAAAAGFVIAIAALAAYLPARRAARVDPLVALRTE